MSYLIFDIETIPDLKTAKSLFDIDAKTPEVALQAVEALRQHDAGTTFQKHFLHEIVAISVIFEEGERLECRSLGEVGDSEAVLLKQFFGVIDKYEPTLVSWNGSGFDLPVIHYRALKHGIVGKTYWDNGYFDKDFKWSNYLSRYHERHLDLMDVLASYSNRAFASLNDIAKLLGLPGKMDVEGSQVSDLYLQGKVQEIRDYCETDVLNTYLIFLRFELIRGRINHESYRIKTEIVQKFLRESEQKHFQDFLSLWSSCRIG